MKKTLLLLALLLFSSVSLIAQPVDMAERFTKTGYVEKIDYDQKLLSVNYIVAVDKNSSVIQNELIQIEKAVFLDEKKKPLNINNIKFSDKITIVGDKYPDLKYNVAREITLLNPEVEKNFSGRLDYYKDDLAIVNGFKVKMKSGKKIKGKPKSGYVDDYNSFNDLKLGIMVEVNGNFNSNYLEADKFMIAPPSDTKFDEEAANIDKEIYDKLYPFWIDSKKRASQFGTEIEGYGKIVNDATVQEYVGTVAEKLIPLSLKRKINFIFIVVENQEFIANVRANGLAIVSTGLLRALDNEAQLATILSHEISHVLYKHNGDELEKKKEAEKDKNNLNKNANKLTNILTGIKEKTSKSERGTIGLNEDKEKKLTDFDKINQSDAAKTLKANYIDHQTSQYSIKQELEADRVGLALMVLAGYDPREAPLVWKNRISNYEIESNDDKEVTLAEFTEKELSADPKTKNATKDKSKGKSKTTINQKATSTDKEVKTEETEEEKSLLESSADFMVRWKSEDFKAKSYQSHPDQIERFEELNKIISAYWNNEELYKDNQIVVNAKKYEQIKKRITKNKVKNTKK